MAKKKDKPTGIAGELIDPKNAENLPEFALHDNSGYGFYVL